MDQLTPQELNEPLLTSGHTACGGCAAALGLRHTLEVLGKDTILVLPASCTCVYIGSYDRTAVRVPATAAAFETGGSTAAGVRAGLLAQGLDHVQVLSWVGDGGTFDIGLQSLSGAAERNDDIIYVCYDNEAYMNTGVQRSSATPQGCWTTTTPLDSTKREIKKNIVEIMAAHRIPYIATATVGHLEDFRYKVAQAKKIRGTRFLHLLTPCAVGWRMPSSKTIKMSRLAVETGLFPLLEIRDGLDWRLTYIPEKLKQLKEYLAPQGRFKHLTEEQIAALQDEVFRVWERIKIRCEEKN
jgi:pyruvate/2-oxoacid:ferredoxin oxidoreductase beta subunit